VFQTFRLQVVREVAEP